MRNKISGAIGVIWGSLILFNGLSSPASEAGVSAYRAGQMIAMLFGVLLVVAGIYYFFKKPTPKS